MSITPTALLEIKKLSKSIAILALVILEFFMKLLAPPNFHKIGPHSSDINYLRLHSPQNYIIWSTLPLKNYQLHLHSSQKIINCIYSPPFLEEIVYRLPPLVMFLATSLISSSDQFTDLCSKYPFRKFFSSLVSKLAVILNGAVLRSTLTWSPFWSLTFH